MHDRTNGERDPRQVEWEVDQLVWLLGRWEMARPESPLWDEPRFAAWQARTLRAAASGRGGRGAAGVAEDAAVVALGERLRARAAAARLPVRRIDCAPDERPAVVGGLVEAVVDHARALGCAPFLDLAAAAGAGREIWDAECESWVEIPSDLPRGRVVALRISGDSMAPLMHSGDVVLVQLGPKLVGDTVVVARRPEEGYVVKRVGKIRRTTVELLSLNPDYPPLSIPRDDRLIVGTVLLRWCSH